MISINFSVLFLWLFMFTILFISIFLAIKSTSYENVKKNYSLKYYAPNPGINNL